MRAPVGLFPAPWRERYGDEFGELFAADPRRLGKWFDAVRTAAGLQWQSPLVRSDVALALLLGGGVLTVVCDVALGVGMDVRTDLALLARHWWGASFVVGLGIGAVMAVGGAALVLAARWRTVLAVALVLSTFAVLGSAIAASADVDLVAPGAGGGLIAGSIVVRVWPRTVLGRRDLVVLIAVPATVFLGWRSAASPVGPGVVVGLLACVLALRRPAGRSGRAEPRIRGWARPDGR